MFQNHYDKPATELGITDIQNYLHYLKVEKKLSIYFIISNKSKTQNQKYYNKANS